MKTKFINTITEESIFNFCVDSDYQRIPIKGDYIHIYSYLDRKQNEYQQFKNQYYKVEFVILDYEYIIIGVNLNKIYKDMFDIIINE